MRTREEIEADLFEMYDHVENAKNEFEEWERELSWAYEKVNELEVELSTIDQSEGEAE